MLWLKTEQEQLWMALNMLCCTLATEFFTKENVWKTSQCIDSDPKWADVIYKSISTLLAKKKIKKNVSDAFPLIKIGRKYCITYVI